MTPEVVTGYRCVIILLAVFALFAWLRYWRRDWRRHQNAVAPISWLINVLAFFVWTTFIRPPLLYQDVANSWSRIVYIHALIMLSGAAIGLTGNRGDNAK